MNDDLRIAHNAAQARYDIFVGDVRAGFAEYELSGTTMTFTHTVTSAHMRGRGLAERVVRHALGDARAAGHTVVPQCWFVAQFIDGHPEYADLLGPSAMGC